VQEYEEITKENFDEVIANSVLSGIIYMIINPDNKSKYFFEQGDDVILTDDFDEFLAFVQKRITLKPLLKELSLVEWFDKLESGFEIRKSEAGFYIKDKRKLTVGNILNDLPRPQQEELILKIIEVYGSVK